MRRAFVLAILILIALSMILSHACAMPNTDKDHVAMAMERTLNDNAIASISYSVNIVGPNNDINVTVMSTEFSQKNMDYLDANEFLKFIPMYIYLIKTYPDLGNLSIAYENDKGTVDSVYGLRSWAEQVRKDDNGYGSEGYRYNRDDLSNFAAQMLSTDALLAKAEKHTAASNYVNQSLDLNALERTIVVRKSPTVSAPMNNSTLANMESMQKAEMLMNIILKSVGIDGSATVTENATIVNWILNRNDPAWQSGPVVELPTLAQMETKLAVIIDTYAALVASVPNMGDMQINLREPGGKLCAFLLCSNALAKQANAGMTAEAYLHAVAESIVATDSIGI